MVRKTIFFAAVLCTLVCVQVAKAQEVRINIYSAYAFDDQVDSYYSSTSYYEGTIKGGHQFGGGIEYTLRPEYGIELLYLRQDTHAPTTYATGLGTITFADLDLDLNYIMLGGSRKVFSANEKLEGFGGLMAGMLIANMKDAGPPEREASATKFAWGLRLGGVFWASPSVGIKVQGQLLSAVQSAGGSFYFGTGGAGAGVASYSTMYQFTIGGGLTFKIKK